MSYWNAAPQDYRPPPAATPGWQFAPYPTWGTNPARVGPRRLGVGAADPVRVNNDVLPRYTPIGCCGCEPPAVGAVGDQYRETTWGHVALASAGSIGVGMLFGWAWCQRKPGR